jgi:hypothetical protein
LLAQVVIFAHADPAARRKVLRAWGAVAVLFAPWAGTLVLDTAGIAGQYWIPPPTWGSVTATGLQFLSLRTPCPSPPCSGYTVVPAMSAQVAGGVVAAVIALMGMSLVTGVVRRDMRLTTLCVWLLAPFAIILSLAVRRPLYLDRVFLDATYPLYLLIAAGLGAVMRSVRRIVSAALVLGFAVVSAFGVRDVYAHPTNPDWRPLVHDLRSAYRPSQAAVFIPGVIRSIAGAYLPPGWRATKERRLWYHAYLDVPGWTHRYAGLSDTALRDLQLRAVTRGERDVWLVTMAYTGTVDTRRWFGDHGFHLILSEIYPGDTRLELWSRGLPKDEGPAVLGDGPFGGAWERQGRVLGNGSVVEERGNSSLSRSFRVTAGSAYFANIEWRGFAPANPNVMVRTYDAAGKLVGGGMTDRFGDVLTSFPRTEWYNMPANGVWLSQPFGFVAPTGAVRAVITLHNAWGTTDWRHIAVYRER